MSSSKGTTLLQVEQTIKALNKQLDETVDTNSKKWTWSETALAIVEELRGIARENMHLIRGDLDKLLAWPDERSADPELFYDGKHETFMRGKNWFAEMGFTKHDTEYTFTNTWDRAPIQTTFLVPNSIKEGKKVPFVWFFHGGGLCTGANDHIPWYSRTTLEFAKEHQAIIIAPDYPLGPEANYEDIFRAVRDFLYWYTDGGYFKADKQDKYADWRKWLLDRIPVKGVELGTNVVYVEGESAGAAVAVTALWTNAHKHYNILQPINAALLRYPMIAHYKRDFPSDNAPIKYMGKDFTKDKVQKQAEAIRDEVDRLERMSLLPSRMKGYAPQCMSGAFLLSTTKIWEEMFKRAHKTEYGKERREPEPQERYDSLERAELLSGDVYHNILPPIVIYHGHDDANCPIEDTTKFKDILLKHYDDHYVEGYGIRLITVRQLEKKPKLFNKRVGHVRTREVGHGFDYDLERKDEDWLADAYLQIKRFWLDR